MRTAHDDPHNDPLYCQYVDEFGECDQPWEEEFAGKKYCPAHWQILDDGILIAEEKSRT